MTEPTSVDAYIATFPKEAQSILTNIRESILEVAPNAEEGLSYKIPTYKQHGVLLSFAAYDKHIGLYPTPTAITHFKEELAVYKSAKGSVQFPIDRPMPLDFIKRMTVFKMEENLGNR